VQANVESNKEIMQRMTKYLTSIGIKTTLVESTKIQTLIIKGMDNVKICFLF
jgi:hypothetical protein